MKFFQDSTRLRVSELCALRVTRILFCVLGRGDALGGEGPGFAFPRYLKVRKISSYDRLIFVKIPAETPIFAQCIRHLSLIHI